MRTDYLSTVRERARGGVVTNGTLLVGCVVGATAGGAPADRSENGGQ
jgi:hypothetical protein